MTKLAAVKEVRSPEKEVIATLEGLLERAKSGELTSIACAYELAGSLCGHSASFGVWANRPMMVGQLQVLATHIILNECLEWQPK